MTRPYEFTLSGLDLTEPDELPASGFWFKHYGDDWDFGVPTDTERTIEFTVAVCGYTSGDIHDGERLLSQVAHTDTAGRLDYLPPESGPRTLFWTKSARMTALFEDLPLVLPGTKYVAYRVTLTCHPYAYPETVITETFSPGTTTTTTVDQCTANTNWAGTTAVTFLTQSAVRLGPITASVTGYTSGFYGSGGVFYPIGPNYGVERYLTYSNGTSPSSGNYMYIDFAYALSGFGGMDPPYLMVSGSPKLPVASQLQSDGYMRYFWIRQNGPLTFWLHAYGMSSGDTASFYVDELGTATVLPSGSLFSLTTKGSVACDAQLRISHPTALTGLGETLVYADPTMLTHGWQPNQWSGASGSTAPDGTYWIYVQPTTSYAIGDVFSLTVAGQTQTTRAEHTHLNSNWIPMGPFQLGGRKSRRLGTVTGISDSSGLPVVALLKNGSGTGYTSVAARLFRQAEDSALVHAWLNTSSGSTAHQSFFIDPASIDIVDPGMFAGSTTTGTDATSVLSLIKSWGFPRLIPPTTALWVQCANTTSPSVSVTHRPPFHTLAAEY